MGSLIGIVGGMAFLPFFAAGDETLFSKLNATGSQLARITVALYPLLQNLTSIPVFSILMRYNLLKMGCGYYVAVFLAVVAPWVLSVPFYGSGGFQEIAQVGGMFVSPLVNLFIPAAMFYCSVSARMSKDCERTPLTGGVI